MDKNAVILLSGGLDSATVLALAQKQQYVCHALSFRYGQRHQIELDAAVHTARSRSVDRHRILDLALGQLGGSALTDHRIPVPEAPVSGIPATYVPARNTVFLAYALAYAETIDAADIFIGVNALDYSGYPDCRPEYIEAFERMANLATKAGVDGRKISIHTPLINMTKAEIIRAGTRLGVDYSLTVSCYQAQQDMLACGVCDSCRFRMRGFAEAGVPDPTRYRRGN